MLPKKRFDQAKPFVTLGIILVAWWIVPTAIKTFTRASFFEMQAPLTTALSRARDLQEFWSLRAHSNSQLIEAGVDLARLTASYELSVQQNTSLQAEVARLEQVLRLPSFADYRSEHARVARRDFSGWWQRITIRKGANYGIPVGAPVIFSGGVVGRVSEVYAYSAVVELISSPSVRLAGVIEGDTQPISFQGGINETFSPPRGIVEFVPLGTFVTEASPKRLVTSGLGGVFPGGLSLGRITKLEPSTDGLFLNGEVELDPRLSSISEVTVLVPLVKR